MRNFGELKQILLGHVTRQELALQTEGGADMLSLAINTAVTHTQRQVDFEFNKTTVRVACNPTGDILTNVVKHPNGEAVKIKRIIHAYGKEDPGLFGTPPIDYVSKNSQVTDEGKALCGGGTKVVHSACEVYLVPTPDDPYHLYFEAVVMLPELVNDNDTNFLFEYGFDYLTYRSMQALNFYLKEDQRFEINMALLKEAENSLYNWNAYLIAPTETEIDL